MYLCNLSLKDDAARIPPKFSELPRCYISENSVHTDTGLGLNDQDGR